MAGIPDKKKAISLVPISSPTDTKVYPTGAYVIPAGTDGYALVSDSTSPTGFGWSSTGGGGGTPSGPAGGDLAGTYPNPSLANYGAGLATKGSASKSATINVDAKGRVSSISDQDILLDKTQVTGLTNISSSLVSVSSSYNSLSASFVVLSGAFNDVSGTLNSVSSSYYTLSSSLNTAGGDLTGSYPNPTLATIGAAGSAGSATSAPVITIDAKGRVTSLSSTTITGVTPGGIAGASGGDLTGSYPDPELKTIGAAGSAGSATSVPIITTDAKGRVTALSSTTISGVSPGGSAGGDLTGSYPNPELATVLVATGTFGSANKSAIITVDKKGRITSATEVSTLLDSTQVIGLTDISSSLDNLSGSYYPLSASFVSVSGNVNSISSSYYPLSSSYYSLSSSLNTAGGDLTGSYPNPTLKEITAAATSGSSNAIPVITIDSKGRVTSMSTALISGPTGPAGAGGGDLTGYYPDPELKSITTAATSGSADKSVTITIDAKGRVTALSEQSIAISQAQVSGLTDLSSSFVNLSGSYYPLSASFVSVSGTVNSISSSYYLLSSSFNTLSSSVIYSGSSAGGDLTGSYPNPTLALVASATGTFGSETLIPVVTVDSKGRVTNITTTTISGSGGAPSGPAGGDLTGSYPNPTLIDFGGGLATKGSASKSATITVDAKGRVSSLTDQDIAISQSQVTNLTTDLSGKVSKTGDTMTGTLTQSVSIDFPLVQRPSAVTASLGGAGSVSAGTRTYYCTYYTSNGETNYSPSGGAGVSVIVLAASTSSVNLTIPTSSDSRVTGRKIYVTLASNSTYSYLVTTITNNTATAYTHSAADPGSYSDTTNRDNNTNKFLTVDGASSMFLGNTSTTFGVGAAPNIAGNTAFGGANTAIGALIMSNLSTGYRNTAVGLVALNQVTTGYENTGVGTYAGQYVTSSNQNSFLGVYAGYSTRGSSNTAVGWRSLGGLYPPQKSDHNTSVGYGSLYDCSTGYQNIALGSYAGRNIATGYNNIIIGVGVNAPLSGGAAQLNIGNVVYGLNMYGNPNSATSTPRTNGKIGIGLTTPTAVLHLRAGTTSANTAPLRIDSGSLMTSPETGSIEFDGDKIYLTITSSTARKEFTLNDGVNSANLVPYTTTNGRLTSSFMQVDAANKILTVNGSLTVTGAVSYSSIKTITTASYTVLATDATILANATGGAITINLPAVASSAGRILTFKKIDSSLNAITLDGNGSETIDGSTTKNIGSQYQGRVLQCDGATWWIIANA